MSSPVIGFNGQREQVILSEVGDGQRTWRFGSVGPRVIIGPHHEGEPVHVRLEFPLPTPPEEADIAPGEVFPGGEDIRHLID